MFGGEGTFHFRFELLGCTALQVQVTVLYKAKTYFQGSFENPMRCLTWTLCSFKHCKDGRPFSHFFPNQVT